MNNDELNRLITPVETEHYYHGDVRKGVADALREFLEVRYAADAVGARSLKTIEELRAELVEAEDLAKAWTRVRAEARVDEAEARSEAQARYENVAKIEKIKAKIEALKKDNELKSWGKTMETKNIKLMKERTAMHIAADEVIQGRYNDNVDRGSFIGCHSQSDDHWWLVDEYGIPLPLVSILGSIFHSLFLSDFKHFFSSIPDAIAVDGKDLSLVHWRFLMQILEDMPKQEKEIQAAIDVVIQGMSTLADGGDWPTDDAIDASSNVSSAAALPGYVRDADHANKTTAEAKAAAKAADSAAHSAAIRGAGNYKAIRGAGAAQYADNAVTEAAYVRLNYYECRTKQAKLILELIKAA